MSKAGEYSALYLAWVAQAGLPPLTNAQHRFAEWLLENAPPEMLAVGDMESVFVSVRRYLKTPDGGTNRNQ